MMQLYEYVIKKNRKYLFRKFVFALEIIIIISK